MTASSLSLLIIADRGWANQRELRTSSVSANWQVSSAGRLSATIATRDAWLQGIDDYLDKWVLWVHPLMGAWGGRVEDVAVSFSRGTLEISCSSFAAAMKKRRTAKRYGQASGPPGSLVLRAMTDLSVRDLPFTTRKADTSGNPVSVQWRGDDLYSLVSRLANHGDMQFDVTVDPDTLTIDFEFRAQTGSDKSGSVCLIEGYQIADGSIVTSSARRVNDILAVSGEQPWDSATSAAVLDGPSIRDHGRYQETRTYYGFSSPSALANRARVELQTLKNSQIPMSLRLSDRDPQLADFIQGDTIRVVSHSMNAEYLLSVTGRAVNASTGVVTIVGDAEVST